MSPVVWASESLRKQESSIKEPLKVAWAETLKGSKCPKMRYDEMFICWQAQKSGHDIRVCCQCLAL